MTMNSVFDPGNGTWQVGWPGRVSKHDLVYLAPPSDPMQGMPIGNGDVGVLCWCEDSQVILSVNKCDLWDDARFGRFHNWKAEEEEYSTTLRHACRIIFDFQVPVFDLFYLSDFKGRLSLADASLTIAASGPFGSVSLNAFVNHRDGVVCCRIKSGLKEDLPVEITIERFGSRTFSHWYSLVNRNPEIGIRGTASSFDKDGTYIAHRLTGGKFAVGCRVVSKGGLKAAYSLKHSRASRITLSGRKGKKFTLMAAVTSPLPGNPVAAVKQKLASAQRKGWTGLFKEHKEAWKSFWVRSLMESGDDYLDNLWHLTMYYAKSSQRGKYPGRFINGLWNWNRDVQPWNFYFHWNQQQIYWPLNAAGHHELVHGYLEYRFNSLPHAKRDVKDIFRGSGAVVSDVCERRGYNSASEFLNHTPVAQIALDFWRQYRFTGDADFLKKRALPYILEAAYFFESLFEKGGDGKYHAKEGAGYEGWIKLKDVITELACAKALFCAVLEALEITGAEDSHAAKWREICHNLAPFPVIKGREDCFYEEHGLTKFKKGFFKGNAAFSDQILAAGFGIEENRMLTSKVSCEENPANFGDICEVIRQLEASDTPPNALKEDLKCYDGIFPGVECSTVFPSGLIGIAQKGTGLYETAVNTAMLYAPDCMGWDPLPIVLARLGLGRETRKIVDNWPSRWQFYCNGFGHYGTRDFFKADGALKFRTALVRDASLPERKRENGKFRFPTWPFRHMGMESMSVLACAMNESLLQSYDGIIRVAPAVTKGQNARFTLHAIDGFVVSSEIKNGRPAWISIRSLLGKGLRVENPWPKSYFYKNGKKSGCSTQKIMEFPTQKSDALMFVPEENTMKTWKTISLEYRKNKRPKTAPDGKATLGLERMF